MMQLRAKVVSYLSLAMLCAPSVLFLAGRMSLDAVKTTMLCATISWFITAVIWMWPTEGQNANSLSKSMLIYVKAVSYISLLTLTVPAFVYLAGKIDLAATKTFMAASTTAWFVSTLFWMWPSNQEATA